MRSAADRVLADAEVLAEAPRGRRRDQYFIPSDGDLVERFEHDPCRRPDLTAGRRRQRAEDDAARGHGRHP